MYVGCLDFAFPKYNLIVECDGDYWHGNPKIYKKLSEGQKIKKRKDKSNEKIIKSRGWRILRFWESEINKDISNCVNMVERMVNLDNN